ncbi:hypothetical protein J2S43_005052 [Catenuloplanes nepalensis]|uniref:Uncharacterized protein n=1 Tax=Catenuloplanes nepalensis TaxID=587533 RepID=A0ABT9MYN5_9ACTN|nr:hypothetical protein [Catenuloplanes nepalensis]MDP9796540.1 hypothetical protein [Catenuloplanes nepalensis]
MTEEQHHEDKKERRVWRKIDLVKLAAGTLAAISSAVCASWLGVTGTIVGAALASVIATVGQELYAHSLKHTYQRLRGVRLEQALAVVGATTRVTATPGRPVARPAPTPRTSADTVLLDAAAGDRDTAPGDRDAALAAPGDRDSALAAPGDRDSALAAPGDRDAGERRASDRPVPARAAALSAALASTLDSGSDPASGSGTGPGPASGSGHGTLDSGTPDAATHGDETRATARARFASGPDSTADDDTGRRAHWARLALAAVAMFVFAMLAIYAFELMAGDSLAGLFGDGSAGATTLPFLPGGDGPAPVYTPEPSVSTVPADPGTTATAPADAPQTSAPADTPATPDPAPTSETDPQPGPTTDPVTPPDPGDTLDTPAGQPAPAIED